MIAAPPFPLVVPAALAPVTWWTSPKMVGTRLARELPPGPCRLFAATLAAGVLPLFERKHPGDLRPRRAVAAARGYALGRVTARDRTDAGSDALAATLAVAWDAAWDATWSVTKTDAWSAAGSAAECAAWSIARPIAGSVSTGPTQWASRWARRAVARDAQARLLRLYLTPRGSTRWLSPDVRALATAVVADPLTPDGSLLPVLADALADAGAAGWLTAAFRDPAAGPLCCPGWWLLRTCCPLPTTDPDGVPLT